MLRQEVLNAKKVVEKLVGGDNENERTDEWEDQILNIIGEVPISGHPNTVEPTVSFEGYQMVIENEQVVEPNCVLLPVADNMLPEIEDDLNLNTVDISDLNPLVQENLTHLNVNDCFTTAINNIQFAGKVNGQPNLTTDNSKSKIGVLKESINASKHMAETNNARNEI